MPSEKIHLKKTSSIRKNSSTQEQERHLFSQLRKLEFEMLVERALLIFGVMVAVVNVYFHLNTRVLSTQTLVHYKNPEAKVSFSSPVSRLIVSVHSSPYHSFKINWDRPSFRDTMYRDVIIESSKTLLPNQEYLVMVQGVRTIDRLNKLPQELIIKTTEFEPKDMVNFTYIEEADEKYIYMNNYPDYIRLVDKK